MLRFDVYRDGAPADKVDLSGAYLFGQDSIPVRAEIGTASGQVACKKRAAGPCGLSLLWDTGPVGRIMLSTTRLPERKAPYNLNLELARARMMLITKKLEDWGFWDYSSAERLVTECDELRKLFVEAIKINPENPAGASRLADDCLSRVMGLSERTAVFHADAFLNRRRKTNSLGRFSLGCVVDVFRQSPAYQQRLTDAFDFVSLPMPWKQIEPKEKQSDFTRLDAWTQWAIQHGLAIHAGPLVSFEPQATPDWLYIWEHDYESMRDLIYEYVHRIVKRYAKRVRTWNVISGVHAHNNFNLNFEQLIELTRLSCSLVKKASPRSTVVIDLVMPWGEYYARSQRTIPPMLYADMCVQSGVKFDAFGVQVYMGAATDGMYVRDLLQVSELLDGFASFGIPLHVTACQAPSSDKPDQWDHWRGQAPPDRAGIWHKPWNGDVQADWMEAFYSVALSKPYVESVSWRDLADYENHYLPHGGLCNGDLSPKPAYARLKRLHASLAPQPRPARSSGARQAPPPAPPKT